MRWWYALLVCFVVACFGGMIRWYANFGGMPGVDACAGGMRYWYVLWLLALVV